MYTNSFGLLIFLCACQSEKLKKINKSGSTYTTTKPTVFVVTKSSSKDSAALSANTQCFKSRPVRKQLIMNTVSEL